MPEERLSSLREQLAAAQVALRERQRVILQLQEASAQREEYIRRLLVQKADLERRVEELGG